MGIDLPTLNGKRRREIILLIVCLLIGFALRFYTFDQKSLWLDEIYSFNDSRYGFKQQIEYYQQKPNYLQAPLFPLLVHLFYPFTKPERDLRIIPLIFGTLSIPMLYLLARQFSASIALSCALSLAFMTYHISLSQDGRSYALLLFLGICGLYFFMKYTKTLKRQFLLPAAFFFGTLLYTSYSSIPFIVFSQILWFYDPHQGKKRPPLFSLLIFNGLFLFFCLPWFLFLLLNYKGQLIMSSLDQEDPISLQTALYGILQDWVPHAPLVMVSIILLMLSPIFSKLRQNALLLLAVLTLPVGGLYLCFQFLNVHHFISSRYFINFLPLFFITLYLSIHSIEDKLDRLKRWIHLRLLFVILFIASNLMILPFYYQSQKQDFRSLVSYLKINLRDGDRIIAGIESYIPGLLHYFGVFPKERLYFLDTREVSEKELEYSASLIFGDKRFTISHSKTRWVQHMADGKRLWILVDKRTAKEFKNIPIFVPKGYFDGSFLNFDRFPTDASFYLFLWDPASPKEKGIDIAIE